MTKHLPSKRLPALGAALTLLLVTMVFAFQKIAYYSAEPVGEKECPPVLPDLSATVQSQLTLPSDISTALPWKQQGGYLNDASCLNKTSVYGVVKIQNVEDIQKALQFAKEHKLHVSMAGVRHSMGGQAFS